MYPPGGPGGSMSKCPNHWCRTVVPPSWEGLTASRSFQDLWAGGRRIGSVPNAHRASTPLQSSSTETHRDIAQRHTEDFNYKSLLEKLLAVEVSLCVSVRCLCVSPCYCFAENSTRLCPERTATPITLRGL